MVVVVRVIAGRICNAYALRARRDVIDFDASRPARAESARDTSVLCHCRHPGSALGGRIRGQAPLGERGPAPHAPACGRIDRHDLVATLGDDDLVVDWGNIAEYRALFEVTWGPAGIVTIDVERSAPMELEWGRVIGALLDRPLAAFCRALRIGPLPASAYTQFDELLAQIAVRPRAALHRLEVRGGDSWYAAIGMPDLEAGFPALRELAVSGRRIDGRIAHPTLTQLRLYVESSIPLTDALGRLELPGLRRFAIGTRHPQLGERAVDDILGAPWLLQLEELDLSGLALDKSARVRLANHSDELAHLRLVLD